MLERLSRLRQGVYRLFGAGFSYPTTEMLSAAGAASPIFGELGMFDYAFAPDISEAAHAMAAADLGQLSVDYVALFEAGVAGAACPPHESAHRSDARTGEVAGLQSELKRTILRFGLRLDDSSQDMVDHIATEMNVMAMLCQREAVSHAEESPFARVVSSQLEFLNGHLLKWVPGFADLVQGKQRSAAYTALAGGLNSFLMHERQLLPQLVAEAEG